MEDRKDIEKMEQKKERKTGDVSSYFRVFVRANTLRVKRCVVFITT